jgi:hypothetical protein
MKVLISQSQYKRLIANQGSLFPDEPLNYIYSLCKKTKNNTDTPYCKLYDFSKKIKGDELTSLNKSVENLFNFFTWKKSGILPKIINLSLNSSNTVSYLNTISDFINDPKFNNTKTRQNLKNLDDTTNEDDLENILKSVRNKEYSEYEDSFVGDVFIPYRTKLELKYKCDLETKESFFDLIKLIQSGDETYESIITNIKKCIEASILETPPIKADLKSIKNLTLENGRKIFNEGELFEVKKINFAADSYLSEFFSIFKQGELGKLKPEYINLYNHIIDDIFVWINENHTDFLEKIKKNLSGIILDNYTIINIEDIELYWSNAGQRGSSEHRLAIRYRIKQGSDVLAYKYTPNSPILTPIKIKPTQREKIIYELNDIY